MQIQAKQLYERRKSMNKQYLKNEFLENSTIRTPVCFCVDARVSMKGDLINEVNNSIKKFFSFIEDEHLLYGADVCIVAYGEKVQCISDFSGIEHKQNVPALQADGNASMGDAISMALDLIEKRKDQYKQFDIDYFQPCIVLMSGSKSFDEKNADSIAIAQQKVSEMVADKKLNFFAVTVGENVDTDMLAKFSPKNPLLKIETLDFMQFFHEWNIRISLPYTGEPDTEFHVLLPDIKWSL